MKIHAWLCRFALLALIVGGAASAARAEEEVVIGLLYPLSGNAAQVGADCIAAARAVADIVNDDVSIDLPLGPGKGLPGLKGAKVRLVVADTQGKPDLALGEAERMITQEKVHALFGTYFSSTTASVSQVAERMGMPMLNAESSSPGLTERGFKYFFRTSPHDGHFSKAMFDFLKDLEKQKGVKINSVAILHEDTVFGTDSANTQEQLAKAAGYTVVENITYRSKTTSLTAEVQRLKAANADVFLPSSYTDDAMLFMRTAKELDYNYKLLVAQNAGYSDPTFLDAIRKDAEGVITRSPFALDLIDLIPLIKPVNEAFKKHSRGRELSDVSARVFTGFMTLMDAINRAGSTDPEKVRAALAATNIPATQLIMPWSGIKFDEKGQNTGVRAILLQAQRGKYVTIYPFDVATKPVVYPVPAWNQR